MDCVTNFEQRPPPFDWADLSTCSSSSPTTTVWCHKTKLSKIGLPLSSTSWLGLLIFFSIFAASAIDINLSISVVDSRLVIYDRNVNTIYIQKIINKSSQQWSFSLSLLPNWPDRQWRGDTYRGHNKIMNGIPFTYVYKTQAPFFSSYFFSPSFAKELWEAIRKN